MPSYATTKLASLNPFCPQNEELIHLDPRSSREATLSRVAEYRRLFAYRYTRAIVTRRGQGPSAWTAYRGRLVDEQIIHHLLADRLPGRPPIWYGSRSFQTSMYLCLDVDVCWFSLKWKFARFELAGKGWHPLKRSGDCTGA